MNYKRILSFFIALAISICATGCGGSSNSGEEYWEPVDESIAMAYMKEAFTYTFPLVYMHLTMVKATNAMVPTTSEAPINQFWHQDKIADVYYGYNSEANRDVVCSQAFLDLSRDAVVFEKPITDRFCLFELFDAYTNCTTTIGSGGDSDDNKYLIVGPHYQGEAPSGMTLVKMPTNLAWLIGRIRCFGEDDLPEVAKIQEKIGAKELKRYNSGEPPPYNPYDVKNNFVPITKLNSLTADEYFNLANQLMVQNPPAAIDADILSRIKRIKVGPGLKFDSRILGDNKARFYESIKQGCMTYEWASYSRPFVFTPTSAYDPGAWTFYAYSFYVSNLGKDYQYRAFCAYNYLGAHPNRAAVSYYKENDDDEDKAKLRAGNKYRLLFKKDMFPPLYNEKKGFWSITLYDSRGHIVTDNVDYYSTINDLSGITPTASGTLEVSIEPMPAEDSGKEKKQSMRLAEGDGETGQDEPPAPVVLYTPESGTFYMVMRVYLPRESVVNGFWPAPQVLKVIEEEPSDKKVK